MPFSYDLSTDIGRMRAIIPDNSATSYAFEDEELEVFLGIEGSLKRGTALALETIASNETMVLKVIQLLDIKTDGAKVGDALLKRAALLRKQADDEEIAVAGSFDIAEQVFDQFTWRERLHKQALRGA